MSMKDSVFNEPTKMLLQKNKGFKKTVFESGSQSVLIAKKRFVQVKSFTTATKLTKQFPWQVKQEPLKHNQVFFFFSSFRNLTTQLKVYTDQNIQNEVVPLETD